MSRFQERFDEVMGEISMMSGFQPPEGQSQNKTAEIFSHIDEGLEHILSARQIASQVEGVEIKQINDAIDLLQNFKKTLRIGSDEAQGIDGK
jgi:hypothetical protein